KSGPAPARRSTVSHAAAAPAGVRGGYSSNETVGRAVGTVTRLAVLTDVDSPIEPGGSTLTRGRGVAAASTSQDSRPLWMVVRSWRRSEPRSRHVHVARRRL